MKARLRDLLGCFIISLKIFLGIAVVGSIVGGGVCISKGNFEYTILIEWIYRLSIYVACLALFIVALGSLKSSLMDDLSHIDTWRTYFSKFNFIKVVAYIGIFLMIFGVSIQYVLDFMIRT